MLAQDPAAREVCSRLSLDEQGALFEEWALQVFFAFCSPLED